MLEYLAITYTTCKVSRLSALFWGDNEAMAAGSS
jgi:hypothetical protein